MFYIGNNEQKYNFNLFTKITGSVLECPIVVKQNNIELTQIQYDKLKIIGDGNSVIGDIDVYVDFHYIRDKLFNKITTDFITEINDINGITNVWNNLTSLYENFDILNIAKYIDTNCIMRVKYTDADFIDINLVMNRQADTFEPIPIRLKIETPQLFILKDIAFSYSSEDDSIRRVIFNCYIDANNSYVLYKTEDNRIEFIKTINKISKSIISDILTFDKFQVLNIMIMMDMNRGTRLMLLQNGLPINVITNKDNSLLIGNAQLYLHDYDNTNQCNGYIENIAYLNQSYFTDNDTCKNILTGISTMFQNKNMIDINLNDSQTVNVFPNNYYLLQIDKNTTIKGKYGNINLTSKDITDEDIIFKTSDKTNCIQLNIDGGGSFMGFELTRLDIFTQSTNLELSDYTWKEISEIQIKDLNNIHGGVI